MCTRGCPLAVPVNPGNQKLKMWQKWEVPTFLVYLGIQKMSAPFCLFSRSCPCRGPWLCHCQDACCRRLALARPKLSEQLAASQGRLLAPKWRCLHFLAPTIPKFLGPPFALKPFRVWTWQVGHRICRAGQEVASKFGTPTIIDCRVIAGAYIFASVGTTNKSFERTFLLAECKPRPAEGQQCQPSQEQLLVDQAQSVGIPWPQWCGLRMGCLPQFLP